MRRVLPIVVSFLILLLALPVLGQTERTLTISGKVIAEDGLPLVGVNVIVKDTYVGGATGREGDFSFQYKTNEDFVIAVSYIGYKPIETTYRLSDNLSNLRFEMVQDPFLSEEVVVTGIASRTAKAVAEVAVSHVSAARLQEQNSYAGITELMAGKIAGVNVTKASGNLGGGMKFRVRSGGGIAGNGQPLIIIDGIRMENTLTNGFDVGGQSNSTLAELNPEDIESVEVLKGPAGAASYGTSGSNGVVVITTKRGGQMVPGAGKSFTISYKGTLGSNRQAQTIDAADHLNNEVINDIFRNGPIEKNHLSISGGAGMFRYYVGADRSYETGHSYNNFSDRQSFKANLDVFASENFTLRVSTSWAYNEIQLPDNDNNIRGFLGNTILMTTPWGWTDSLAIHRRAHYTDTNHFLGSIQAEFKPMENLEGSFTIGIDDADRRTDRLLPTGFVYGSVTQGSKGIFSRNNKQKTLQGSLKYSYEFRGITASSTAGFQVYDNHRSSFEVTKEEFLTPLITTIEAGDVFSDADEMAFHAREAGIFTEHQFSYDNTYFGSFMIRKDYATVVGYDAPSIFYPRASTAVRLDNFDFTPDFFGLLKFRMAYGESGTLPGRLDGVPFLWSAGTYGNGVGGFLDDIGNREIKPERVKEIEFGFDTEFLDNYAFDFTAYKQYVSNSIVDVPRTPSSGLTASNVPMNIGALEGWGLETMLQASFFRSRDYSLSLNLINNYQNSEVTDLGGAPPIFSSKNVAEVGMPKGQWYYYAYDGPEFDADGKYNGAAQTSARVDLGHSTPTFTGSFSVNFRFLKNFNATGMLDWMGGHIVENYTKRFQVSLSRNSGAVIPRYRELEHILGVKDWTEWLSGRGSGITALAYSDPQYAVYADEFARMDAGVQANFLEDGDFLKLREVSLSYDCTDLLRKIEWDQYLQGLTVGFSASNLITWTKYTGLDPEITYTGVQNNLRGLSEFLTLPHPKVFQFWLRLSI